MFVNKMRVFMSFYMRSKLRTDCRGRDERIGKGITGKGSSLHTAAPKDASTGFKTGLETARRGRGGKTTKDLAYRWAWGIGWNLGG